MPLRHLVRRFFEVVRPRPLGPAEQDTVARRLKPAEAALFWRQCPTDQRHAYEVMRRASTRTADPGVLAAALLHDVGKAGTPSGALTRTLATVLDAMGMELGGGLAAYRAHGHRGAMMLAGAGSSELCIDFARRHPDPDPGGSDAGAWRILLDADEA